ncbi:hypothetical protein Syun_016754 [Stephania yunnanensis]|uniref:Leucine-rich repeat-containing N-terminal plant-type domain-containing protein n=1 Tax=Stephania yunnanensis TaxID=152371 RepID=A0AAP0P1S3_9MAGN
MGSLLILIASLLTLFSSSTGDPGGPGCNSCHPDDYNALLRIKKGLNNPYIIISWEENGNCKDWCCIECDDATHRVTSLDIERDTFKQPTNIPAAIGDLPYLTSLTLRKLPNLTGPIPPSITNLKKLTFLFLDYNSLTGPVPAFLSELRNLNSLVLSNNKLSGNIPESLSTLPIRGLFLDRNNLSGPIPNLFKGLNLSDLYIDMSRNQLSGGIPAGFGELDITSLRLGRNRLTGDASMLFGRKKGAYVIDISRNLLEFDFSKVRISKKLTNLEISHNRIYGSLPKELSQVYWQSFNVSYNRLCGEIPSGGTGRLQDPDRVGASAFVHNKCLCGPPLPNNCTRN